MTWIHCSRFAKKVKNAGAVEQVIPDEKERVCPTCNKPIDNDNEMHPQEFVGLPAGVKFDPNDKEILDHLAAQIGRNGAKPHALIDEFIPTLDDNDGICSMHPEKLPGVKSDGSSSHFFHRPANAYTKGTRKRRKVQTDDDDETRWHKTGKTRPVVDNGDVIGWKKIMVLYTNFRRKSKPKKTNWVIHQYHIGSQEDEREGELVMSKVFYQTQPRGAVRETCEANEAVDVVSDANEADTGNDADANDHEAQEGAPDFDLEKVPEEDSRSLVPVVRPCPSRDAHFLLVPPLREAGPAASSSNGLFVPSSSTMSIVRCPSISTPAEEAAEDKEFHGLLCEETLQDGARDFPVYDNSQDMRDFAAGAGISCDGVLPDWEDLSLPEMNLSTQEMMDLLKPCSQTLNEWQKLSQNSQGSQGSDWLKFSQTSVSDFLKNSQGNEEQQEQLFREDSGGGEDKRGARESSENS